MDLCGAEQQSLRTCLRPQQLPCRASALASKGQPSPAVYWARAGWTLRYTPSPLFPSARRRTKQPQQGPEAGVRGRGRGEPEPADAHSQAPPLGLAYGTWTLSRGNSLAQPPS